MTMMISAKWADITPRVKNTALSCCLYLFLDVVRIVFFHFFAESLSENLENQSASGKDMKVKRGDIALYGKPVSELRNITCHMGSQCYLPPNTGERAPS